MNPGDRKPRRGVRRQNHVQRLRKGRRIPHRRDRIDVRECAGVDRESRRRIHPRVRDHDEDAGGRAAHGDQPTGEQMHARRYAFPAVEIQAEENRLREEGESLEREWHPDDGTGDLHEARPQQAELEGEHGAGDRADREEDRGALRPALGEIEVRGVTRPLPAPLREHHEDGHRDPDDGKDDVKRERHRHL